MRKEYVARDGERFNEAHDCFNHEWREFFPGVKVYDHTDSLTSDVVNAVTIRIHNSDEYEFVQDYLCEICGLDYISGMYLDNKFDGVFWHCDDDPEFVDVSNVCNDLVLYQGDDSDLALEFEDILPELPGEED